MPRDSLIVTEYLRAKVGNVYPIITTTEGFVLLHFIIIFFETGVSPQTEEKSSETLGPSIRPLHKLLESPTSGTITRDTRGVRFTWQSGKRAQTG